MLINISIPFKTILEVLELFVCLPFNFHLPARCLPALSNSASICHRQMSRFVAFRSDRGICVETWVAIVWRLHGRVCLLTFSPSAVLPSTDGKKNAVLHPLHLPPLSISLHAHTNTNSWLSTRNAGGAGVCVCWVWVERGGWSGNHLSRCFLAKLPLSQHLSARFS